MPSKTQLVYLLDSCPKDQHGADFRICTAGCKCYAGEPRFGAANCTHPDAKSATETERNARREAFHATAGIAHLSHCGTVHGRIL